MNHPLRVLHVAETIRGGIATVLRQLLLGQIEAYGAANVWALVPADHATDLHPVPPANITTFSRSGRNPLSLLRLAVATVVAVIKQRPQVVHIHSTFAGVVVRPLLWALRPLVRPKVVYCPHGWAFLIEGSQRKQRLYALIERLLLPLTDVVICVSAYERQAAQRMGLNPAKLQVVYNGVPLPNTPPVRSTSGPLKALYVGRLDTAKGFDVLHAAMQQLADEPIHLDVVGEAVQAFGHGGGRPAALPNLTYHGWQNTAAVAGFMQAADVLIMPSRWEGFAMVPLEAMSHGLAVVASDVTSVSEAVQHNVTGLLVPPANPRALAATLGSLTKAQCHALGAAGYKVLAQRFTASAMQTATAKLYTA